MRRVLSVMAVVVLAGSGCSKKDTVGPPPPVYSLTIRGGDGQQAPAGATLDQPLQVTVANPADEPVRGVVVRFRVLSGTGASVSDTLAVTGLDGIARVEARLGPAQGPYEFRASVKGQDTLAVVFTVTATAPPTLISAVPTSFGPGDTVDLTGTDFNSSLSGNTVFVGGSRARIVSGTTTTLRIVVPACLTPGSVPVRVQIGNVSTNSLALTYSAATPTLTLAELEGITVSGTEVGRCLRLPGAGARYLIVPQFATGDTTANVGYNLGAFAATAAALQAARLEPSALRRVRNDVQARFDRMLRDQEHAMAPSMSYAGAGNTTIDRGIALQALTVGSTRSFKVLGNLQGTKFNTVSATLRYVGDNILLYVDAASPSPGFSDGELLAFGALFDKTLYALDVSTFGSESDIDGNGHVAVLLSPAINALTPSATCTTSGFVTGYFFGFDLDNRSTNSNKGEVFYALAPDPGGTRSCPHSVAEVKRIVPATFVHEFQHMISFNQHVMVRGGSDEDIWLNEGLSHIAEEMASRYYEVKCDGITTPPCRTSPTQMFPDSSQGFILGDLLDAYDYLLRPDTISVTRFKEFGELEERGAAWLFLRWLGDQKGNAIFGKLVQTSKTSILNIEDKSGESFGSLFGDFGIAIYTDSLPGISRTAVPQRYRFVTRNFRAIYKRLFDANPGLLPKAFPVPLKTLQPDIAVASTMVTGTMDYYQVLTGTAPVATLQFSINPGQLAFPPSLKAQVGVFRLPP